MQKKCSAKKKLNHVPDAGKFREKMLTIGTIIFPFITLAGSAVEEKYFRVSFFLATSFLT